ncbi:thiamine pyrophosphate-dependent enzyme, partial [Burkholderia pseudomallei]|uniref:thiamine pyrophosphate-dependent enzyme n=1 Tax=Burkholderia pseudomallei TaxID=28450 RepID=UPI0032428040
MWASTTMWACPRTSSTLARKPLHHLQRLRRPWVSVYRSAVGAQVARPNDTVVCISGDGSFMMNVQELGTVKRKQLPLKIVLLDNQRLGMVRQWQQLFFQERYSETTLTDNPDFLMLASAFGIPGQHITRKDQVEAALDTMLNSDGPYLLHVSIDELENVWPLVPPGASNSEMLEKLS